MTKPNTSNDLAGRYSFVCNAGCGVCSVKVRPFEYHRTETLEGEHLDSKYRPQIVSSCCGSEVHVYDNHADHWGAEVTLATPPEAPAAVTHIDLAHELYAMAQGPQPVEDAVQAMAERLAAAQTTKQAPRLTDERTAADYEVCEWMGQHRVRMPASSRRALVELIVFARQAALAQTVKQEGGTPDLERAVGGKGADHG